MSFLNLFFGVESSENGCLKRFFKIEYVIFKHREKSESNKYCKMGAEMISFKYTDFKEVLHYAAYYIP